MKTIKLCLKVIFIVILCVLVLGVAVISLFWIGEQSALGFERFSPNYERVDISGVLAKGSLSEEDYELIYLQTGLTRVGLDSALDALGASHILAIQDAVFGEHTVRESNFAPFCHYYSINHQIPTAPLKRGDIIVSSSTEFSFWSVGHCAMVTDVENGRVIEAIGIGSDSKYGYISTIMKRGNFVVLRPNLDEGTIEQIVKYTEENLIGVKYDPTIGILSRKYVEDIKYTHCAHIFWYAYYEHGIDIDSNGGPVVTPRDILFSEHFEIIQVAGFDPVNIWD